MPAILKIKNLTLQKNGKLLLDRLSFDLEKGKIYAIIGPNGAGKSTIANCVMGLGGYKDYSGDILFAGKNVKGMTVTDRAKLGITLAWQEPARFEGLTVRKYLSVSSKNSRQDAIESSLESVGLPSCDYMERAADSTLSGGERKRIEIAAILAMKPKLAIFDEPDSGVDLETIGHITRLVSKLKQNGSTVLLITHSEAILKLADFAFLICSGRVIDQGTSGEVKKYYKEKCKACKHKNVPST